MSRKEREQLKVLERLERGELTQSSAAEMLNITDRAVRKKLKRYRDHGDAGLIHKSRGKPSKRRWNQADRELTIGMLRSEWQGFGPTFTVEKLKEFKNISVSVETVRQTMITEGLWVTGKQRQKYRKMRKRKLILGVLIQLDGSPHDWFEGRGPKCTLLVFIDDATSKILWLEFVASESFEGVAKATKAYIEKHGRPVAFYVDYGSVFSVNLNNPERDKITQFERILKELNIDIIHASSPQAKGRVERCNKTMQDRLVKEMRLAGMSSMEEANKFVVSSGFIEKHNTKFGVAPAQEGDAHRSIEGYDLYKTFCTQEERVITNDYTVRYKGKVMQLAKHQPAIIRPKNRVTICEHLDKKLTISIRNYSLNFKEIYVRETKKLTPAEQVLREKVNDHNDNGAAYPLAAIPQDLMNQQDFEHENRNFSCW